MLISAPAVTSSWHAATIAARVRRFPNGRFEPVPEAGHLPHLEQPDRVLDAIHRFADHTTRTAAT